MDGNPNTPVADRNDSLDPSDWSGLRALGHRMVDDMFDHLRSLRDGPVWRPMPEAVRKGPPQAVAA